MRALGLLASCALVLAACGTAPPEAVNVAAMRQADDRPLEEKVDTDGDGEMSQEEIETYARQILLDFSDCMRENGFADFTDVVLEDFTEGGGGGQGRFLALMAERGVALTDPNAVSTLQLCGEDLGDLQTFAPQPSDAELQEREQAVLEFADCMRDGGLTNWPDPDFANNPGATGYSLDMLTEFDLQSTEVQDAIAACQAEGADLSLGGDESDDGAAADSGSDVGDQDVDSAAAVDDVDNTERTALSPVIEGDTSELNIVEVTRRDLIQTTSLSGTLGYGESRLFPTNTTGIVTSLPAEGDVIEFGETLFTVDNEPVVLFQGAIPQYRPFASNMSDGPDIEQLEANLVRFGYADDHDLTVDDDFTSVTRNVIEEMQMALGIDDDGRIDLGRVVFSTSPVRIGEVRVELGQSVTPQTTMFSTTGSEQRVTLDLDAEDRSLLAEGDTVDIELPDGAVVAGLVTDIASVATQSVNPQSGTAGDATIAVTLVFVGDPPDDVFDAAPVDIIVIEQVSEAVLTVPVPALIALSGGGHAVELVVEGGTQLIEVELGDFVDDLVEVSGEVREGDRVVTAGG